MQKQLGKYQLIRRLGSGGMAEVFLARTAVAHGLSKELVIKKIHPAYARLRELVSMFVTEAKIALGLNHPNIVQVFDFGAIDDSFFLAMEYVDGLDLLQLLRAAKVKKRPIPLPLCAHIVKEMAKGLDYAHRKTDEDGEPLAIVHRDVSPHNVLLSWDGAVKLVDFGIARARGIDEQTGGLKGKYSYMSPEQARGEDVDRRSDIFSAGVVLFEMCCGRPLFPGRGARALDRVRTGAFPRPRDVNPAIPAELEKTILEALSFHPGDRFATARDLHLALDEFLFHQAARATDIVGSDTLADFLTELVPRADRGLTVERTAERALAEGTPASELSDFVGGDDEDTVLLEDIDPDGAYPARLLRPPPAPRQRKHVVVAEVRLTGHDGMAAELGEERSQRIVGGFFSTLRNIAFKHHGYVHTVWDEGAVVLFGLPLATEDDASRAIRMGLGLIEALRGIVGDGYPALRLTLGIQRGVVEISRDTRGGRDVELPPSQRVLSRTLSQTADPGDILVGSQIYRMAKRRWYFDELPAIPLPASGDDTPPHARAFRLTGAIKRADRLRDASAQAGALIGRDLEMKALHDAYRHALTAGHKRAVLLVGDAGIGKRTLVNGFLARIASDQPMLLRATPQVNRAYTPYAVLAELARDMLGLTDESGADELRASIEGILPALYGGQVAPEVAQRDAAAVARLFGADFDEHEAPGLDASELRQRISELIVRVERTIQPNQPLVFVCEDLHWADDESLELFGESLARPGKRPLLGILTTRPDPRVAQFATDIGADVLRLSELDLTSTKALIASHLADRHSTANTAEVDELARQIYDGAGGNPFFVCEMLDNLIDRGMLVAERTNPGLLTGDAADMDVPEIAGDGASGSNGASGLGGVSGSAQPPGPGNTVPGAVPSLRSLRWIARDPLGSVPSSVEALLSARIDHLPEAEKEALLRAAVLGRVVRPEAVTALVGRPADDALESLVGRGLLRRYDGAYGFHNDLSMAVAYRLLPEGARRRLHREAATLLSYAPTYRPGPDDAAVAAHLARAGDPEAAADCYLTAAVHAIDVGGNSDALRQLDRALELVDESDHQRRFTAHGQRQEVLRRLARRDDREHAITQMSRAAAALDDLEKIALSHIRLAECFIDHGQASKASEAVDEALARAREADDFLAEAHALQLAAQLAQMIRGGETAIDLCDKALALCDESKRGRGLRATVLGTRGRASWSMGHPEDAIASFSDALAIYRNLGLLREEAEVLDDIGTVFATVGELEEALRYHKDALLLDKKLGDRAGFADKLCNIGQAYTELGDDDRAEHYLHRAIKLAEQIGDNATTAKAVINLGKVQWLRDDHRRALVVLKHGLEMARASCERYQEVRAMVYLAMIILEAGGDVEQSLDLANRATELASAIPMPLGHVYGLAVRGLAVAHKGRFQEAADTSARAVAEQSRHTRPENAETVLYFHAMLCEAAGRMKDAARAIDLARQEVERKAGSIQDRELQNAYVSSKIPRAVMTFFKHLGESVSHR